MEKAFIGLIGLGVMGTSLARNMARNGYKTALYNRFVAGKEEAVAEKARIAHPELAGSMAFDGELPAFIASLERPRRIILMVQAGAAVDSLLDALLPLLEPGDVVADGGNSHYTDTQARQQRLAAQGIYFIGMGVSGGEQGALLGPAMMPSGPLAGFSLLRPVLEAIAARNREGELCCAYLGEGGGGHFVKMVHNGIEYAEMQLLAELYTFLRYDLGRTPSQIAQLFSQWNEGEHGSYLLEITANILRKHDNDGTLLIDKIMDSAGNKGTGSWTSIAACELGVPIPGISAALFARFGSAFRERRLAYAAGFTAAASAKPVVAEHELAAAYRLVRLMNHQQGLWLIETASAEHSWQLDLQALLRIWSGGCIIRSKMLGLLRQVWAVPHADMLTSEPLRPLLHGGLPHLQKLVSLMALSTRPFPVFAAALDHFKALHTARSSAYLIQAQRDYFGAHTYRRLDDQGQGVHHTEWE